ncbi:MAG: polysaccharide pyruvyl transferase family protein [Candidatus Microsaccharimonas sp.]
MNKQFALIIPTCTDFNRGDQALVLETKRVIDQVYGNVDTYMMSTGETVQCEAMGLKKFSDILKHPSRFDKKGVSNMKYGVWLKVRWGVIAVFDFLISLAILNNILRKVLKRFLSKDVLRSIELYENSEAVFVKGGGFLHDYSKGLIGLYSIYYQTYHIKLALKMKKSVYIMPNSYGPFKNKSTATMVRKMLSECKFVSARESVSGDGLRNGLGIDIPLYPDLGFFLRSGDKAWAKNYMEDLGMIPTDRLVAITVRPYRFYSYDDPAQKYNDYKDSFVRLIKHLNDNDYRAVLVVHTRAENDHENDARCVGEIYDSLPETLKRNVIIVNDNNLNCFDLKAIYGICKYVIGTRFHSVIFAIEQGIPCIAVTYGGNKGEGIMSDMKLEDYAVDIAHVAGDILVEKFNKLIDQTQGFKKAASLYVANANERYKELIREIN